MDNFSLVQREGQSYCASSLNSTGQPAFTFACGSTSIVANDFKLTAAPVPSEPYLFFHADNQIQFPFGNGFLCAGGNIQRLNPPAIAVGNVATRTVDLPTEIAVAGTRNFQCWFRDPTAGGAAFNLSNGLEVVLVP